MVCLLETFSMSFEVFSLTYANNLFSFLLVWIKQKCENENCNSYENGIVLPKNILIICLNADINVKKNRYILLIYLKSIDELNNSN